MSEIKFMLVVNIFPFIYVIFPFPFFSPRLLADTVTTTDFVNDKSDITQRFPWNKYNQGCEKSLVGEKLFQWAEKE